MSKKKCFDISYPEAFQIELDLIFEDCDLWYVPPFIAINNLDIPATFRASVISLSNDQYWSALIDKWRTESLQVFFGMG